jgi:hypothetical protein
MRVAIMEALVLRFPELRAFYGVSVRMALRAQAAALNYS